MASSTVKSSSLRLRGGTEIKNYKSQTEPLASATHTHRSSHLSLPVVTPCFLVNAGRCTASTACVAPHREFKNKEGILVFGLRGPASQQEMAALFYFLRRRRERPHKGEEKKKKPLTDLVALFYCNAFRWEELKAGLHKHSPLFIVTRHLKQWRCGDGGLVLQLRPLHVPQPERRRGQQEANEKSTCDKRERERESQNRASVMESVFPTKVSSPTVVPVLLLECSIFWKVAAPPCQLPRGRSNGGGRIDRRAEKWRMRLSDRWSSGSS